MSIVRMLKASVFPVLCYYVVEKRIDVCFCQNEQQTNGVETEVVHEAATASETLHDMDVDDLLKYINGDNDKSQAKVTARKAAKRARQKQRKVPESFMFWLFC